ncbi:MAG: aminotransferase class I/II-fold pyridoxal phosphate-dependent enzyme, partial [Planctomycetes bacterium]|nr:aminotransferase class I/II-fold pyridoxal phosphate-dependent enzyme [Planctomycetota bacterium]
IHEFAYSDFVYDGHKAPSILQVPGAKDIAVEFHTISKSYSMPGLRFGFAVGNPDVLASLAKTKNYVDFGLFKAVQWAAIKALSGPQECVHKTVEIYHQRRDVFIKEIREIGWEFPKPKGTFYVWGKIPLKFSALTSLEFATLLMKESGVVIAPGSGFGEYGEGYVRFALVENGFAVSSTPSAGNGIAGFSQKRWIKSRGVTQVEFVLAGGPLLWRLRLPGVNFGVSY